MISLDTETTGVDFRRGARPFFVTTCDEDGEVTYWEWDVNPLTREVIFPPGDVEGIRQLLARVGSWEKFDGGIQSRHRVVLQNVKFDVTALASIGVDDWPWRMTEDTLMAGHLLASNQPHNLTDMALHYLGVDIEPYEKRLEEAVQKARRTIQQARLRVKRGGEESDLARWRIAEAGLEEMPSAKEKTWKFDTWLPRALVGYWWEHSEAGQAWVGVERSCKIEGGNDGPHDLPGWEFRPPSERYEGHHPWWTILAEYANTDSEVTLRLWEVMREELGRRKLTMIYCERLKVLRPAYQMEQVGVTVNGRRLAELEDQYRENTEGCRRLCEGVAASMGHELTLPKAGNNGALLKFACAENGLNLPGIIAKAGRRARGKGGLVTGTGKPSLAKEALEYYLDVLDEEGSRNKRAVFLRAFKRKRKLDTALMYMAGYRRFWIPVGGENIVENEERYAAGWYRLHPSFNATGTDTLRWSSSNPNAQNISKQEDFNLRYPFGPGPGREWWSLDYENIELRIPAYESGQESMIELFERPDEPPYFGSYHLLNASYMYEDLFWPLAGEKGAFKKRYGATWYQWAKNAGFALIYGCQEAKFDATAKKMGAYRILKAKLPKLFHLSDHWLKFADKHGYVETVPDKTVDPHRGYPILCTRTEWGKVLPTVPLNYHVQSTAMWCTSKAMVRCQAQLDDWNKELAGEHRRGEAITRLSSIGNVSSPVGYYMVMQVHDEIVFDFPKGGKANLPKVQQLQRLMEQSGKDIGIPLKVAITYNPVTWAKGEDL